MGKILISSNMKDYTQMPQLGTKFSTICGSS